MLPRPHILALAATVLCLGAALLAVPVEAQQPQAPTVEVVTAECVPNNDNGLIEGSVEPEVGGAETRLYFRWDEHGDFYYVVMEAAGGGEYWATPPKPTDENERIEYYLAVVGPDETVVGRSETVKTPVTEDCPVVLSEVERGYAENLVVGETVEEQVGDDVLGFLCDGIISRIGADGVLRADGICRRCIVAWWDKPRTVVPAAVLLGGGTIIGSREASPSRP